jgi:hypothetical protein
VGTPRHLSNEVGMLYELCWNIWSLCACWFTQGAKPFFSTVFQGKEESLISVCEKLSILIGIAYKNASLHPLLILKSQGCKGPFEVNLFSLSLWCLVFGIPEKNNDGLFQIPSCQEIKMRYPITIKALLKTHCRCRKLIPSNINWVSIGCFVFNL